MQRPKSDLSQTQDTSLPGLQKGKNQRNLVEEIEKLKIKTHQLETEKRQLQAKTIRMKQIIHDRNAQIQKALTQSNEHQTIKTASDSTIEQLKKNISSLQNTLDSRKQELETLKKSDRLSQADEMLVELREYYNEYERLNDQIEAVKSGKSVLNQQITRLNKMIGQIPEMRSSTNDFHSQIEELTSKIEAYRKCEIKSDCQRDLATVSLHPESLPKVIKLLNEKIDQLNQQIENEKSELATIQDNDEQNMKYLQSIIDDQSEKIKAAIANLSSNIPEEEKNSEMKEE